MITINRFKPLAILGLTLIVTLTVSAQTNDLKHEGLSGSVHTVHEESSESLSLDGQKGKGRDKKLGSLTFNAKGQILERVIYDDYGFLVGTEKYSHDASGQVIVAELHDPDKGRLEKRVFTYRQAKLEQIVTYNEKDVIAFSQVYKYDENGKVREEVYYSEGKAIGRTSFKSDPSGKISEAAFFGPDGSQALAPIGPCFRVHKVVYTLNRDGKVMSETAYETDGSVKRKSSYRYDNRGNLAEELRVDSYSTLKFAHSYTYDARGNWITKIVNVQTSREPLFGETPDRSERKIVITRKITYY